jgi:hypothetical protein
MIPESPYLSLEDFPFESDFPRFLLGPLKWLEGYPFQQTFWISFLEIKSKNHSS